MLEIEKKFRITNSNKKEILAVWDKKNLTPCEIIQQDEVFLYGINSFSEFKQGEPVFRIRSVNDQSILTLKKLLDSKDTALELESLISNTGSVREMLLQTGYNSVTTVRKKRLEAKDGEFTIAVDFVEKLGDFLEVEILRKKNTPQDDQLIFDKALEYGISKDQVEERKYDRLLNELGS